MALVRERTILTERPPLVGEVSANFADKGCCVVSAAEPYSRNLCGRHPIRMESKYPQPIRNVYLKCELGRF
jgi:hypothetical protein